MPGQTGGRIRIPNPNPNPGPGALHIVTPSLPIVCVVYFLEKVYIYLHIFARGSEYILFLFELRVKST